MTVNIQTARIGEMRWRMLLQFSMSQPLHQMRNAISAFILLSIFIFLLSILFATEFQPIKTFQTSYIALDTAVIRHYHLSQRMIKFHSRHSFVYSADYFCKIFKPENLFAKNFAR